MKNVLSVFVLALLVTPISSKGGGLFCGDNPGEEVEKLSLKAFPEEETALRKITGNFYGNFPDIPREVKIHEFEDKKIFKLTVERKKYISDDNKPEGPLNILAYEFDFYREDGSLLYSAWFDGNKNLLGFEKKEIFEPILLNKDRKILRNILCRYEGNDLKEMIIWFGEFQIDKQEGQFREMTLTPAGEVLSTNSGDLHYETFFPNK